MRNKQKVKDDYYRIRLITKCFSWGFGILFLLAVAWFFKEGYFTDSDKMQAFLQRTGIWSPIVFLILQIIQVAIPIFPGGASVVVSVLIFGKLWGFILNYIGVCTGSLLGFHIAKTYGRHILKVFFSPKMIEKYDHYTMKDGNFTRFFTIAIFSPIAPDDFLCYLAGTTKMSYRTFITIILLGKPSAIYLYSVGVATLLKNFLGFN